MRCPETIKGKLCVSYLVRLDAKHRYVTTVELPFYCHKQIRKTALVNTHLDMWLYAIFQNLTLRTSKFQQHHVYISSSNKCSTVPKANMMIIATTAQLALKKITTIGSQHIILCSFLTSHDSWSVSYPGEQLLLQYRLHYNSTWPRAVLSSYELQSWTFHLQDPNSSQTGLQKREQGVKHTWQKLEQFLKILI